MKWSRKSKRLVQIENSTLDDLGLVVSMRNKFGSKYEDEIPGLTELLENYDRERFVVHQPPQDGVCLECLRPPIECYECDGLGWLEIIYDKFADINYSNAEENFCFIFIESGNNVIHACVCLWCDGTGVEND